MNSVNPEPSSVNHDQAEPDEIIRKGSRVFFRIDGETLSLRSWLDQPGVTAKENTVRNRLQDYEAGKSDMSIRDIVYQAPKRKNQYSRRSNAGANGSEATRWLSRSWGVTR